VGRRHGVTLAAVIDQDFPSGLLAEKGLRTCRKAVGAGLEYGDDIADIRSWYHDVIGKAVERRAEAADDACFLGRGFIEVGGDGNGVVAADDLAEIAEKRRAGGACPPSVTRKVLPWLTFLSTSG
jgi:hypothetical protein